MAMTPAELMSQLKLVNDPIDFIASLIEENVSPISVARGIAAYHLATRNCILGLLDAEFKILHSRLAHRLYQVVRSEDAFLIANSIIYVITGLGTNEYPCVEEWCGVILTFAGIKYDR
jgi:hypothetical protein